MTEGAINQPMPPTVIGKILSDSDRYFFRAFERIDPNDHKNIEKIPSVLASLVAADYGSSEAINFSMMVLELTDRLYHDQFPPGGNFFSEIWRAALELLQGELNGTISSGGLSSSMNNDGGNTIPHDHAASNPAWFNVTKIGAIGGVLQKAGSVVDGAIASTIVDGQISLHPLATKVADDLEGTYGLEAGRALANECRDYCSLLFPKHNYGPWTVTDFWNLVIDKLQLGLAMSSGRVSSVQSGGTGLSYTNDGKEETLGIGSIKISKVSDEPSLRKTHKDL